MAVLSYGLPGPNPAIILLAESEALKPTAKERILNLQHKTPSSTLLVTFAGNQRFKHDNQLITIGALQASGDAVEWVG